MLRLSSPSASVHRLALAAVLAFTFGASSCATHQNIAVAVHAVAYDTVDASATAPGFQIDGGIDVKGYGAEVAFTAYGPDFLVGVEQREYEDVDAREYWGGLRWMFGADTFSPYLMGKLRYGEGLEFTAGDSDEYIGWGAGGGFLVWATDVIFFDLNLMYEAVFQDIDAVGADVDLDGWVGTVGVGVAF